MNGFTLDELRKCYNFAKDMRGNHNPDMIMSREEWEIFRDDFRGKLGEVALKKVLNTYRSNCCIVEDIDYSILPRCKWDTNDLVVDDMHINVKSAKGNSRFLMIEKNRYNDDGSYAYKNHDGSSVRVDAYVFVKINITPEYSEKDFEYETIEEFMNYNNRNITYWVSGAISHEDFWRKKHFAPKGILCNISNLKKVCKDEIPEIALVKTKKEYVLQKDNYIIDSESELVNIVKFFKN